MRCFLQSEVLPTHVQGNCRTAFRPVILEGATELIANACATFPRCPNFTGHLCIISAASGIDAMMRGHDDAQYHQRPMLAFDAGEPQPRSLVVVRWLELTRTILPGMAAPCRWPIRNDHCFMRVCLDAALGAPWHTVIQRPAIRHLTLVQLAAAIAIAEAVIATPEILVDLNRQSLRWRQKQSNA